MTSSLSKVDNALGEDIEDIENMKRWVGGIAVVTDASSGIGMALCEKLLRRKVNVVGLERRVYPKHVLGNIQHVGKLYPLQCDLTEEENIIDAFKWIEKNLGAVSILVNNAEVLFPTTVIDGNIEMWKTTLDVNFIALSICTREAIKSMRKHNIDGHILHVNSICGHFIPRTKLPFFNVYASTKYALTSFSENLRRELNYMESKIKVSMISPGVVSTEINYNDMMVENGTETTAMPALNPGDVAAACMYILATPPHVAVQDLMIRVIGEKL